MSMTSYERIKNSIVLDFEEYMEDKGLTEVQVSARILEEDWRRVNDSLFTKTLYFVSIAIESLKNNVIADFIYSKLDIYLENIKFEEMIDKEDVEHLLQDIKICRKLIEKNEYKILETSDSTKAGVDYILGLKVK
ncbi:hypothetical protein GCM10008018_72140 [Paenibacillus marchantiophytorum]|uniref:Uncharacterized protein n=1 Tax=Paenibacillus marchantiophytorum TaxID=1619310 RepID=A0ABQ1FKP5_9BACL|nr:hypothetical protein [Paenibacillus marchantiophytorum]GGA17502.1 hypothetical protein GCM10008018_72140 [Paenibacillus marchantiophytorum]